MTRSSVCSASSDTLLQVVSSRLAGIHSFSSSSSEALPWLPSQTPVEHLPWFLPNTPGTRMHWSFPRRPCLPPVSPVPASSSSARVWLSRLDEDLSCCRQGWSEHSGRNGGLLASTSPGCFPGCRDCRWKNTWEWRQCLDMIMDGVDRSLLARQCPTELTQPVTHNYNARNY